ncbi:Ger(x)C family spore germination protein [Pseudobacteroides cellulosolvens]|uniref:Germination protein, Ger(X)C family n=1 Tax=Pseudobacteroides cellulosolvens ATCC 35603 = DSM 2933 TaxID=398512 RepID=A0A0L6JJM6_9FIRM|nr:Ger(x)C family spore germination protein [Pseudobacteroides cellulosolvens]KNY26081.1 germination protein, Ger(x)C family [Pseudobacteroides cellulosolvens ATCC 35603 = DSM 2933]
MPKNLLFAVVCIIVFSSLTGCYDAKEITEWGYVYSIGMEKGITDKLRVTVQVPSMKGGDNGGGTAKSHGEIENIVIDCPSFYSGVNMINSFLSRQLNYMHTKYMVFSEELAREGIDTYINGFIRSRQIRRQISVIVSKGSASKFLEKNILTVSSSLSKKQQNLLTRQEDTGFFSGATYGDMLNDVKTYYGQPIAILAAVNDDNRFKEGEGKGQTTFKSSGDYYAGELMRKGASNVEFFGTAVFDGGRMVGELNGDETRALLMVRDEFNRGYFAVKDPKKQDTTVTLDVRRQKKPQISVGFKENNPTVNLKIFLEGDIVAIQSTVDYENEELKPILETEFKNHIKEHLDKTIKKCQNLNSDVFKFGSYAAMHFLTISEWEEYNWLKRFKNVKINTEIEFRIRRTGTMLKSSEIISSEGQKGE